MTEKEKKAIKSMKRFVECRQDMTAVTASETETVLNLLEKQGKMIDLMSELFANSDYCFEITEYLRCSECINKI